MIPSVSGPPHPTVDQAVFRDVVGHFASGVTVITTADSGLLYGTTASAVSSLSMDPPMMLACLNRSSASHDAVVRAGRFAINVLSAEQGGLAAHFGRKGADKFSGVAHTISSAGLPLLDGALATIECAISETATGGTHTIFLGEVTTATAREGEPLAYFRGRFGNLEQSREVAAYAKVREWVLRRRTAPGDTLDTAAIAATLETDVSFVYNALVRLGTEALVSRSDDGGFTPTPITAATVDNLYDARATIESGVIEAYLTTATPDAIDDIVTRGQDLVARSPRTSTELDDFLEANLDFHSTIVGLAGSRQLVSHFRQLSIASVWRDTFRDEHWSERMGHPLIPQISAAIAQRDVGAARSLVRRQVEFVKSAAKSLISDRGGSL